ncbi:MAG: transposase [Chitinispirillaceae bacterium]|nr:transposase [Chitinispirillaceae bacterium]
MPQLAGLFFRLFFRLFLSRKRLVFKIAILEKENEILKRRLEGKRIVTNHLDRLFFVFLNKIMAVKDYITIVQPATVLRWQKMVIRRLWTFKHQPGIKGRRPVERNIRDLILSIKNENLFWGVKRIQGELLKLGIVLDSKTIWNIIREFRKRGKIKAGISWRKFLEMHKQSFYAMDFFTVDTVLNKRFYVLFFISHQTKQIVRFAVTENPAKEFVRQQLIELSEELSRTIFLLHDNAVQFNLRYADYMIKGIATSVQAPNMNAIAERFVGSVRREALDHYIILSRNQLKRILADYIHYYNSLRPHQGLGQQSPTGYSPEDKGEILKIPILSGLHHHYYRRAA